MLTPVAEKHDKRTCFVICPIGDKDSKSRRRSNQVLKHLIKPALAEFDYEVRRADGDPDPGEIPSQIIRQMASADLVIADLTDSNPNVFYELAIRHVAAKPLVQLITAGQTIPFDVGQMRTVYYNLADPDELEEAKNELARAVVFLQDVDEMETPVQASLGLKKALESSDPVIADNAAVLAELQAIRADMERLRGGSEGAPSTHYWQPGKTLWTQTDPVNIAGPNWVVTGAYDPFPAPQEDPAAGVREPEETEPKARKSRGKKKAEDS
jgi:hypothetical protein